MRQRGILLLLAGTALVSLLAALSLHQKLLEEREKSHGKEKSRQGLELRLTDAQAEVDKLKAAHVAMEGLAKSAQECGADVKAKLEALQKDTAAREQALQAAQTQLQTKLTELTTALGELKGQIAAPGTGIAARLDELSKSKEQVVQLATQVTALDAKLKEKEALFQSLTAEKERQAEEIRRHEAHLAALKKELEGQPQRSPGRETAPRAPETPPPAVPVVTNVEASEGSSGVVVLGAGKKSGLETGHVLSISRDGKPIGRVRVIKVYDDLAGAEIIETTTGETIRASDRATTLGAPTEIVTPKVEVPPSKAPPPPPQLPGGAKGPTQK